MATYHQEPQPPLLPPGNKDPPSYDSLYLTISPQQALRATRLGYGATASSSYSIGPSRVCFPESNRSPFLHRLAAAIFVAATISSAVMLLLWQLQNLTAPDEPDRPWFDPDAMATA